MPAKCNDKMLLQGSEVVLGSAGWIQFHHSGCNFITEESEKEVLLVEEAEGEAEGLGGGGSVGSKAFL